MTQSAPITAGIAPLRRDFSAIAIGGSAGALSALMQLLPALPARLPASVFVVLNLPDNRHSLLPSILGPHCRLPVREAWNQEPAQPGHVYCAPPGFRLLIDSGPAITLSADEPLNVPRPAIDMLFESAADIYRDRLLGVVLSGGGDDGAQGLAAIADQGGGAIVQSPASSAVPLMPQAALARCPHAHAMSTAELAWWLSARC